MMTKNEVKQTLQKTIEELGRFPTLPEFSAALSLKESQAEQILAILSGDGFLIKNSDGSYQLSHRERKVSGSVSGSNKPQATEPEIKIREPQQINNLPDTIEHYSDEVWTPGTEEQESESLKALRESAEVLLSMGEKADTENGPFNTEDIKKATETLLALQLPEPAPPFWPEVLKQAHEKADRWRAHWRTRFKRKPKTPPRKKPQSTAGVIAFIRSVMAVVSIGAAVISMFYTSRFTLELFPYQILAYLLSGIMVGFNIMAFELILLFGTKQATDHWFRWPAATAFFLLWCVVGGFSITATVAGQYNEHARTTTKAAMDSGSPKVLAVKWHNNQTKKNFYKKQRDDKQSQNSILKDRQDEIKNDPGKSTEFRNNALIILTNDKEIKQASTLYDAAVKEETEILNEHPEVVAMAQTEAGAEVPDFYGWLARVLVMSRDEIQFWTSLMPAVFVDLIAPIAGAAALFLRGKK